MVANRHHSRVDTSELKALILKKIGHLRADKYFNHLSRLFSSNISKNEFDKVCIRTIGRENISLHNHLIRSIVKNACFAKVPPLKVKSTKVTRNSLQPLCGGDAPPSSTRKVKSPIHRDRAFQDRSSPLGPHSKTHSVSHSESVPKLHEQQSATELHSLGSRPPIEVTSVEDGEEVEQIEGSPSVQSRSPVTAPFGISLPPFGSRKTIFSGSVRSFPPQTCLNSGELPDSGTLRTHLEQKLEAEGLSVTADCADLLNNGLDVYLKRLIEPCIGLARARRGNNSLRQLQDQSSYSRNGTSHGRFLQTPTVSSNVSLMDFRVSMESNPCILGEDWSTQLEKIASRAFES